MDVWTGKALRSLLLPVAIGLLLAACAPAERTQSVSGVLIEVDAAGLSRVNRLVLRDGNGATLAFQPAGDAVDETGRPLNASHLREHMLAAEAITVDYRREGDTLVAQRVRHQ